MEFYPGRWSFWRSRGGHEVTSDAPLPWHFEQLREYVSYEVMLPAMAVMAQFRGERKGARNPRMEAVARCLELRTGKATWVPSRSAVADLRWNAEGDVFRNKMRVFTSLFLLVPFEWCDDTIQLTAFGEQLASGLLSSDDYYSAIISRYRYPHPAYLDNWLAWNDAGRELRPFVYLLQVLIQLHRADPAEAYLQAEEVMVVLMPLAAHAHMDEQIGRLLGHRQGAAPDQASNKNLQRNASDLLGFLCLSGYCYYDGSKVRLNLRSRHGVEHVWFDGKRSEQDQLSRVEQLVLADPDPALESEV